MRYVLDANVALKWVLVEPDSDVADRLRNDYRNAVHDLLAPDCFPLEIAHALTKAERQGRVPDAVGLWLDVMTTVPRLIPSASLMMRALRMASLARIGVYDCLYVALAEQEGCELVTADDRLQRSLPSAPIILLRDLP